MKPSKGRGTVTKKTPDLGGGEKKFLKMGKGSVKKSNRQESPGRSGGKSPQRRGVSERGGSTRGTLHLTGPGGDTCGVFGWAGGEDSIMKSVKRELVSGGGDQGTPKESLTDGRKVLD